MEKFFRHWMGLEYPSRENFIRGLAAGFWGSDSLREKKLPFLLQEWSQQHKIIGAEIKTLQLQFETFLKGTPTMAPLSGRSIDNLFISLNQALEAAIPVLPKLLLNQATTATIHQATYWLELGNTKRADRLLKKTNSITAHTEEEIEAWFHLHRAYYNLILQTTKSTKDAKDLHMHFIQMQKCNDSLVMLRTLRLECTAISISLDGPRRPALKWLDDVELEDLPGRDAILAFQNCLAWLEEPSMEETETLWQQNLRIIQNPAFPKGSMEFREVTRYLLNHATLHMNTQPDQLQWYQYALNLLDLAFEEKALWVHGTLPAQHLINYSSIAIHLDEINRLEYILKKHIKELGSIDLAIGEDKFCWATFYFATQDYEKALVTLKGFKPVSQRKLALYVLKIKILVEMDSKNIQQEDELMRTLESFEKWLIPSKKNLPPKRRVLESQRLGFIQRITTLQPGSTVHQRTLLRDIRKTTMDKAWLEKVFAKRFQIPNDETQEHYTEVPGK